MKKTLVLSLVLVIGFAATIVQGQLKDPCLALGTDCFEKEVKGTGYAPGPWVYDARSGEINSGAGVTKDEDWEGGFEVAKVSSAIWPPKIVRANGRLIAASPALYEYAKRRAKAGDKEAQGLLASLAIAGIGGKQ